MTGDFLNPTTNPMPALSKSMPPVSVAPIFLQSVPKYAISLVRSWSASP